MESAELLEMFTGMALIRAFESETERQYKLARIGGYCHLSSGQEAVTVGAAHALREHDALITSYRSHGFALARGTSPEAVMAELFGRVDGCAHGRGGSMHLLDTDRNYLGGWGIVAGQLPVATGVALAHVRRGRADAVLCELGDGATNMGAWHEALNLAALWRLPVVFLVINNEYGMGTAVRRASAQPELFRRAAAFGMHGERVDGDDVEATHEAASRLLAGAREDRRPAVLEAMTYRLRGHSVADPGTAYRSREEVAEHRARDPLVRVRARLEELGVGAAEIDEAERHARERVLAAVAFAEGSAVPDVSRLAVGVYGAGSAEQFSHMAAGAPFGEAELTLSGGLGE